MQQTKEELLRTKDLIYSIKPSEEPTIEDLIIRKQDFTINEIIENILEDLDPSDEDFLLKINSLSITLPPYPTCQLKSFKTFQNIFKDVSHEKNSIKKQNHQDSGLLLCSDTLLITFTFYHPVHKFKTQEWVATDSNTFEDLHKSIQCLANFCEFGIKSEKVLFIFDNEKIKDLRSYIGQVRFEIGKVYTYLHQKLCQHDMIVSDIRLISKDDPKFQENYPFQTFSAKLRRRKCEACLKFHAKFVLMNDPGLGVAYVYICEICLSDLNPISPEVYPYLYD